MFAAGGQDASTAAPATEAGQGTLQQDRSYPALPAMPLVDVAPGELNDNVDGCLRIKTASRQWRDAAV